MKKIVLFIFISFLSISQSFATRGVSPSNPSLIKDLDELREAIKQYNEQAPEEERITNITTYQKFYRNIPRAPSYNMLRHFRGYNRHFFRSCVGIF